MIDLASLARRANASGDGEAYTAVARGPGYRVGIGARTSQEGGPAFFVEVVLDPFPNRPQMDTGRMRQQAALLERLKDRGYAVCCDDAGVITCERTLGTAVPDRELREIARMLGGNQRGSGSVRPS